MRSSTESGLRFPRIRHSGADETPRIYPADHLVNIQSHLPAQLRRLAFKPVEVACLIHLVLRPSAGCETGTEAANRIPLRDGFMS